MVHAELSSQLMICVKNAVGSLAHVTTMISASGINMVAICAYSIEDTVAIMFVTEDNNEARKVLEKQQYVVREEEVVLLTVENKPGALQVVTDRIADAGINLTLIYGSVDKESERSRIILIAENNLDVMVVVRTQLERG